MYERKREVSTRDFFSDSLSKSSQVSPKDPVKDPKTVQIGSHKPSYTLFRSPQSTSLKRLRGLTQIPH